MKLNDLNDVFEAARKHGEEGDVEDGATHEVGDLQDVIKILWQYIGSFDKTDALKDIEHEIFFEEEE